MDTGYAHTPRALGRVPGHASPGGCRFGLLVAAFRSLFSWSHDAILHIRDAISRFFLFWVRFHCVDHSRAR
eukprot:1047578-Prymnesium_polylepis.1